VPAGLGNGHTRCDRGLSYGCWVNCISRARLASSTIRSSSAGPMRPAWPLDTSPRRPRPHALLGEWVARRRPIGQAGNLVTRTYITACRQPEQSASLQTDPQRESPRATPAAARHGQRANLAPCVCARVCQSGPLTTSSTVAVSVQPHALFPVRRRLRGAPRRSKSAQWWCSSLSPSTSAVGVHACKSTFAAESWLLSNDYPASARTLQQHRVPSTSMSRVHDCRVD
jgi:hypothetical protein